ncbi:DUF6545 domain-containing protein [Micromonospora sp. LOL_023]|uniref:DUF6545 domain-containing protein n=1 Tax=Micromonospora sp. LOL_023 TaxID=3345418 RepID=UPI003A897147
MAPTRKSGDQVHTQPVPSGGWHQRRRLERRLRRLHLPPPPPPYTVDAWCHAIGSARARPITIVPLTIPAHEAPGVWMDSTTTDLIFVDIALSPLARNQTILHELAHIILGHRGVRLADNHAGDLTEEHEAEQAADILSARLTRARSRSETPSPFKEPPPTSAHPTGDLGSGLRARLARWWTRCQYHWQMRPLWLALHHSTPTTLPTGLSAPVWHEGFPLDDPIPLTRLPHAYHRRTIEILDGLRRLSAYIDPAILNQARHRARRACLSEAEIDAIAAATAVRAALDSRAIGAPPHHTPPGTLVPTTTTDLDTIAAHLARTAQALTSSPYVLTINPTPRPQTEESIDLLR